MPSDVDDFSYEVESRNLAALHGTRAQLRRVYSPSGDLSLLVAFGSGRIKGPAVEPLLSVGEALIGPRGRRVQRQPAVTESMRKYGVESSPGTCEIALRYLGAQWFSPDPARRKVDHHGLPGLPI